MLVILCISHFKRYPSLILYRPFFPCVSWCYQRIFASYPTNKSPANLRMLVILCASHFKRYPSLVLYRTFFSLCSPHVTSAFLPAIPQINFGYSPTNLIVKKSLSFFSWTCLDVASWHLGFISLSLSSQWDFFILEFLWCYQLIFASYPTTCVPAHFRWLSHQSVRLVILVRYRSWPLSS